MGRAYEARTNGLVISAVVLAGLASLGLTGNYTYFGRSEALVATAGDWGLVVACGVLGGALGALFSAGALALLRRVRGVQVLARQRQVAQDGGQQVVEVVRHARGELAGHLRPVRPAELLAQPGALGHVAQAREHQGDAAIRVEHGRQDDPQLTPSSWPIQPLQVGDGAASQ